MHCKNCLAPLNNSDTYCKVCGKPVEKSTAYPSNEEIIKSYNEQTPTSIFPEVKTVGEQPKVVPTQSLEQTNVFKPVMDQQPVKVPVNREGNMAPQAPVQPNRVQPSPTPVQTTTPVQPNRPVAPTPVKPAEPVMPTPVATPVAPVSMQPTAVRPEPQPIVNEKQGVSKKIFALGIVIAIVATALIAILICIPIISNKVASAKKEVSEAPVTTKTITEERTLFSGYSFLIPEGYTYKISGTQLIVEKTATKEAMSLQVYTDTYANLKTNLTTLKTNLTSAKWTVGKMYMDQAVKNRVYLTVEATSNSKKVMIAYTKANAKQVFGIVYLNPSATTYPTTTIETFNEIVDSAREVASSPTTNITTHTTKKIFFATKK